MDYATALRMANYAAECYKRPPDIGRQDGACRVHVFSSLTFGHVVAFEGTSDVESLLADAEVETVRVPNMGLVHTGFWDSLSAVLNRIAIVPTAITGHSLGAAHAMLYGAWLATKGHSAPVYCFEPPRVSADDELAELVQVSKMDVSAFRNGNDIVTQVPSWMTFPVPLTAIGTPSLPFDNLVDHEIARVISSLQIEFNSQG